MRSDFVEATAPKPGAYPRLMKLKRSSITSENKDLVKIVMFTRLDESGSRTYATGVVVYSEGDPGNDHVGFYSAHWIVDQFEPVNEGSVITLTV